MWYPLYVGAVGIFNLFLGYRLGLLRLESRSVPLDLEIEPLPRRPKQQQAKSEDVPADSPSAAAPAAAEVPHHSIVPGSWAEIATAAVAMGAALQTTLETALARLKAIDSPAAEVVQQVADGVRTEASNWITGAEQATQNLVAALKKLPGGKTYADYCERLSYEQFAQVETSVSNLAMLDWNVDLPAATTRLTQEVERLIESCGNMRDKLQQMITTVYQTRSGS